MDTYSDSVDVEIVYDIIRAQVLTADKIYFAADLRDFSPLAIDPFELPTIELPVVDINIVVFKLNWFVFFWYLR